MGRARFHFDLIFAENAHGSQLPPKTGDIVHVERGDAETVVKTPDGFDLGTIPANALEDYHPLVPFEGFVRCVTRDKESGEVSRLCVCLSPSKKKREGDDVPRWERETVDEEWLLKTQHYEALVANGEIRAMLGDEKLRAVLKAIDGAGQKETALHEAYESSEDVQKLFQLVLDSIHRNPP